MEFQELVFFILGDSAKVIAILKVDPFEKVSDGSVKLPGDYRVFFEELINKHRQQLGRPKAFPPILYLGRFVLAHHVDQLMDSKYFEGFWKNVVKNCEPTFVFRKYLPVALSLDLILVASCGNVF